MTAAGARLLPYATVIGERTFGSMGALIGDSHIAFDGQFGDINLETHDYFVYTCTWMSRDRNGECLESKGVMPEMEVRLDFDRMWFYEGDNQLEYAIDYLHGI